MLFTPTAMWSDAGVGVAVQRVVNKYFLDFFGYKFTVPKAMINQLAVASVPPLVGQIQYMDHMLDNWYKDIKELVTCQIAGEHIKQQAGFSFSSVDFVIGAGHGQGSFCAGMKVIFHDANNSMKATARYGLGEIECAQESFSHWHSFLS
jgi:hypothetical protein